MRSIVMRSYELEVFFDGDCPLCRREIDWLRRRDRGDSVLFTDIAAVGFRPQEVGKTFDSLMERIHGRRSDGTWLEGVDLFAELYAVCRLPFLSAMMRNRWMKPLLTTAYRVFARHRLRLTGRRGKGNGPLCSCN